MRIDRNTKIYLGQREIVKIKKGNVVIWESQSTPPVVEPDYFYIENTYNGTNTLSIVKSSSGTVPSGTYATSIEYSKDKSTWTSINITGETQTISINVGDKVYFRNNSGVFSTHTSNDDTLCYTFRNSQSCNTGGNVLTLLDYTDVEKNTVPDGCFEKLFENNTGLVDASQLNITPQTMPFRAFSGAFWGCSSLTAAPELPATTVGEKCYQNMFRECTSLVTGPVMRATTLGTYACQQMFLNSTSLNSFTVYVNTKESNSTNNWLKGVASTGTFYDYGSATYTQDSDSGIPQGWTKFIDYFYVENTYAGTNTFLLKDNGYDSPMLKSDLQYSKDKDTWTTFNPSTTALNISLNQGEKLYIRGSGNKGGVRLNISGSQAHIVGGNINTLIKYDAPNNVTLSGNAFYALFYDDTKLTGASNLTLPAPATADSCYSDMFKGCTSLVNAPALPATTLALSCYYEMFNGCTGLTEAPELPATTLANYCYEDMFNGCTALTVAPELPATTLANYCYEDMFNGCTALTVAPELPATTLLDGCYKNMFYGCTSLNSVTILATSIGDDATTNWLSNVASEGTFNNVGFATYTSGPSGIPYGWTEVTPTITSITASPNTYNLKSYQKKVTANSTLTVVTNVGTFTMYDSQIITVGENTGDSTRTLTETIPYKGSSYQVTIVQTANDPKPAQTWSVESTGTYPFQLNSNDYYESTNKGVDNSYSYATLTYEGFDELVLECINFAESNYDYGIISQPDVQLSESITDDGATGSANVFHNFKGEQSANPVQLTIPSDGGSHFITIKFRKDSSQARDNDSLQFTVVEP